MPENKSRRGTNLTQEDRARGGKTSASRQQRDERGQFAGTRRAGKSSNEESTPVGNSVPPDQAQRGDTTQSSGSNLDDERDFRNYAGRDQDQSA